MSGRRSRLFWCALLPLLLTAAAVRPRRPHILLISVDTLRADHLGAYGYGPPVSPFLDSLAKRGTLFENAYVPLPATGPSHASLLTSLLPWKHEVATNGLPLSGSVDTLAAALKRAGYDTAGAVAVNHIGRRTGFARGFDAFSEPKDIRRDADAVNADARGFIDAHAASRASKPLFLFVHYFDCHFPYRWWDPNEKPADPAQVELPSERPANIRRYDDGVRRVDDRIRRLVEYAQWKLGPNVIVVVTADHGEQLGDHGRGVGHADIYRETVAVPLIVAGPGIPAARVSAAVSNMDVGVALARLGGATFAKPVDGIDLFGKHPARPFVITGYPSYTRSVALIDGSQWFIRNLDRAWLDSWIETPAPGRDRPVKTIAGVRTEGGAMSYPIPYRRFEPYLISIEHTAKDAGCAMTANATLPPGMSYYDKPIAFKGSLRLTIPAARLDPVTFTVSPARCAGETRYSVRRLEDGSGAPAASAVVPSLFAHLFVPRKGMKTDELYDVRADPAMLRNAITAANGAAPEAKLRSLFEQQAAGAPLADKKVPDEELRKLRSLGYIQ